MKILWQKYKKKTVFFCLIKKNTYWKFLFTEFLKYFKEHFLKFEVFITKNVGEERFL